MPSSMLKNFGYDDYGTCSLCILKLAEGISLSCILHTCTTIITNMITVTIMSLPFQKILDFKSKETLVVHNSNINKN